MQPPFFNAGCRARASETWSCSTSYSSEFDLPQSKASHLFHLSGNIFYSYICSGNRVFYLNINLAYWHCKVLVSWWYQFCGFQLPICCTAEGLFYLFFRRSFSNELSTFKVLPMCETGSLQISCPTGFSGSILANDCFVLSMQGSRDANCEWENKRKGCLVQYSVTRCLHCSINLAIVASSRVLQKEEAHLDLLVWCCTVPQMLLIFERGDFVLFGTFHTSDGWWASCTACNLTTFEWNIYVSRRFCISSGLGT